MAMRNFTVEKATRKGQKARIAVAGLSGSGKAQPVSAIIQTPTGPRQMGELQIGDEVLTPSGEKARVTGIFPQGIQPIFRVITTGGGETRTTADHLWATSTASDRAAVVGRTRLPDGRRVGGTKVNKGYTPRTLSKIMETMKAGNVPDSGLNHQLPLVQSFDYEEDSTSMPLSPWVLGIILGDGSISSVRAGGYHGSVTMSIDKKSIDFFKTRVAEEFGENISVKEQPDGHFLLLFRGAAQAIEDLKLNGTKSATKFIPKQYLYSSTKSRLALLQGLLDTDGHTSSDKPGSEYVSVSEQLAKDVCWLAESLGGTATLAPPVIKTYTHNGEKRNGQPAYRAYIVMPKDMCPFTLPYKAEAWYSGNANRQRTGYRYISDIIPDGEEECQCISIDHPDRLYLTDHHIPTHNSMASLIIGKTLSDNGKVLVIDTENRSAGLYADEFGGWTYDVINWEPPFDPRDLITAIKQFETDYDVIIIDSFSAFWSGEGGLLSIAEQYKKGNNTTDGWRVATPIQEELIQKILRADAHMLLSLRAKAGVEIEREGGKVTVKKVPLQIIQRENTIYEMTIAVTMDVNEHSLHVDKTRLSTIADRKFRSGQGIYDFAKIVHDWLETAEAEQATVQMEAEVIGNFAKPEPAVANKSSQDPVIGEGQAQELIEVFNLAPEPDRDKLKSVFVEKFGLPTRLTKSQLNAATEYAAQLVKQ